MELELNKKKSEYYKCVYSGNSMHEENTEMIVPDRSPDIARIINGRANVFLKDKNARNGKVDVSGSVSGVVIYIAEGETEIRKLPVYIPFVKPLNRKIGAYYGCLLLRPSGVMAFDNPENPTIIEDFIKAIGGTPVVYPFRNECCGAYVSLKNGDLPKQKSRKVLMSAKEKGAEEVITACPLCLYNLQVNGDNILPVKYFTELLAEALGVQA